MPAPKVRLLSIGSEILQGLYPDTNAQRLSRKLLEAGFEVLGHSAAPDDAGELGRAVLAACQGGCALVVSTGGLGPTEDDLTRFAVAQAYGLALERDAAAERLMRRRFAARGIPMPESNLVQAMLPQGCLPLQNHWGTAPGFVLEARGKLPAFLALPGPPRECLPMFERALGRELARLFPSRPARVLRALHYAMVPESRLNEAVRDLFRPEPGAEMTILANGRGLVQLRVLATAQTLEEASLIASRVRQRLLERTSAALCWSDGPESPSFPGAVLDLLAQRGWTLATAEPCTGGALAKALTDVPGSSKTFLGGWVTYSNEAKSRTWAWLPSLSNAAAR